METFEADDGLTLAYHLEGTGALTVCLPGGPMQDSAYLGDLGRGIVHRRLLRLDLRGTGSSAVPTDESSFRCDHLVRDVEALRRHLGVEKLSLLGHSAGTNLALLYLTAHPDRVAELLLVTPSLTAAGVTVSAEMRLDAARKRTDEPWFPAAFAALETVTDGRGDDSHWSALAPFAYGRWDIAAEEHHAAEAAQLNARAAAVFGTEGAFVPSVTRAAVGAFGGPVKIIAGEVDVNSPLPAVRQLATLFADADLTVVPGAAHFPWLDEPHSFAAALNLGTATSTHDRPET